VLRLECEYRAGFDIGRAVGYREGYAAADADWREHTAPSRAAARRAARQPTHGEQEGRRWKVRGEPRDRATFSQPHPDDFRGGAA
jgi:hypothetical protein